jgi:hypothetical protein
LNLGPVGNTIVGNIGGQIGGMLSGAVLTGIAGMIKNAMAK